MQRVVVRSRASASSRWPLLPARQSSHARPGPGPSQLRTSGSAFALSTSSSPACSTTPSPPPSIRRHSSSSSSSSSSTPPPPHQPQPETQPQPPPQLPPTLSSLKILDLTRVLAGPFCTQILADYGASVLKIEAPHTGDETRSWRLASEAPFWRAPASVTPISCYFAAVNRNKRSLTLNLKDHRGREIVRRLARDADVVVHNFLPGKMEELGLRYEVLREGNRGLVYAGISGYGASGPDKGRAGYDAVVAAEAGLLGITGESDERGPVKPGVAVADLCTGLYMHGAILAAVLAREGNGGWGREVEGSLFESSLSLLTNVASGWMNLGKEGRRWGMGHPSLVPYGGFETKGGGEWLFVAANNNKQWAALCGMLGDAALAGDERFASNDGRVQHRAALVEAVQERFKEKTLDEWLELFEGSGLPYGPVNTIQKAIDHPQTEARKMVESVDFEAATDGVLKLLGPPVKFGGATAATRLKPPLLGEHTNEVLEEMGFSKGQIDELRAEGVV